MPSTPVQNLACLRFAVGALGERADEEDFSDYGDD